MDSLKSTIGNFLARQMKNMVAVESGDKTMGLVRTGELIGNLKKQVVMEERWTLPSETQEAAAAQMAQQQGVVVALEDGQTRYLVRKIPNEQKDWAVDVIVTHASFMGSKWVLVEEKRVENAKLEDYLDQGEDSKDQTEGNLRESEDKKESNDGNLVQSDDKVDSTEFHQSQTGYRRDSSECHKDSEDTASKM